MNFRFLFSAMATAAVLGAPPAAIAAKAPCSIHPKKAAPKEELAAMAKISLDEARKKALATLKASAGATVKNAELEAEHGCLIYSFDVALPGHSGVQEVQVDAGDGRVLSSKHETPKAEAAETTNEKRRNK